MFGSTRCLGFLVTITACRKQVTLRGTLFLFAIVLSSNQSVGQELHIGQPTHSFAEENKPGRSTPDRYADTFRVNVDLILVPVTVTDSFGKLVTGLDKENFQIYEGKEEQVIRHFSSEDSPVSIGIVFDTSGSMKNKIERARDAVKELLETANPQDEFFMIAFADTPELTMDFTTSVEDIQSQLLSRAPNGSTALLDAIYLGISQMRQAKYARKALLVISDGGDNHSRYHEGEIKSIVRESDTLVYAIGICDYYFTTIEEQLGPALLSEISEETGGRMFSVDNPSDLAKIATNISLELRNQYVLGYSPMNPKYDGKWHKIRIKLSPPKGLPQLETRARKGYYAPAE